MRLSAISTTTLLGSLAFAVGCGGTAVDRASAEESASSSAAWAPLLRCDGGAALLDVNAAERRDFQIVIRDSNVVNYFQSTFPNVGLTNEKGEFVAQSADRYHPGAFEASDFDQFTAPGDARDNHPVTVVEREGDGIHVMLVEGKVGNLAPFCNGEPLPEENEGFCDGTLEYKVYHSKADWLFRDCR